jgi:hypothetical protein
MYKISFKVARTFQTEKRGGRIMVRCMLMLTFVCAVVLGLAGFDGSSPRWREVSYVEASRLLGGNCKGFGPYTCGQPTCVGQLCSKLDGSYPDESVAMPPAGCGGLDPENPCPGNVEIVGPCVGG